MGKQPESVEAFFTEVGKASGADARLDDATARLHKDLANFSDIEYRARRVVESMALVLQGSLLVRHAPAAVADAFCASRFGGDWGIAFGTLPPGVDTTAIITRAHP
jgi:putative acyl-CoA dehydrogenase